MNAPIQQILTSLLVCLIFGILSIPSHAAPDQQLSILSATPHPGGAYLVFAGKFGGELEPKAIRACKKLKVDGCAEGSKIFQFTLHITHQGKTTTYKSANGELSKEMLNQLANLEVGDVFRFERIKARLPKGGEVDVHARKFSVV